MAKQKLSFLPRNIKEPGFMYVYLSYEGQGTNWVYFDDLKITHTKTNVIQYNEYYPFGLQTNASWTRDGATGNNYLYNESSELNTTTGWYEMMFRNYDPAIGRMNGIDPMAVKYSTFSLYNYAFNNPVTFSDPSGADSYNSQEASWNDNNPTGSKLGDNAPGHGGLLEQMYSGTWQPFPGTRQPMASGHFEPYGTYAMLNGKEIKGSRKIDGWTWVQDDQQGINIAVTNEIVGDWVVKGHPEQVYDENGKRVVYNVPLYKVNVTGNIGGKAVTRTYRAIRYGVYNSATRGPHITGINNGTFTGEWGTMSCCGEAIHIVGAGNNNDSWIHIGWAQNYAPGAINCVLIEGFRDFVQAVYDMGGGDRHEAGIPISITFQQAQPPPLVPKYNTTYR
jgi:RHS repeat-associated protein